MDAFILLVLVVIYVTISYLPMSEMPKKTWESNRTEQSSLAGAEPYRRPRSSIVTTKRVKGVEWGDLGNSTCEKGDQYEDQS